MGGGQVNEGGRRNDETRMTNDDGDSREGSGSDGERRPTRRHPRLRGGASLPIAFRSRSFRNEARAAVATAFGGHRSVDAVAGPRSNDEERWGIPTTEATKRFPPGDGPPSFIIQPSSLSPKSTSFQSQERRASFPFSLRRSAKRKGRSPRMSLASRSITPRSAPT